MARPTTARGSKLMIQLGDGGIPEAFASPCALTARSFNRGASLNEYAVTDAAAPTSAVWTRRSKTAFGASISGSGVMAKESLEAYEDFFSRSAPTNIQVTVDWDTDPQTYQGAFHLANFNIIGNLGALIEVELEFQSDNMLSRTTDDGSVPALFALSLSNSTYAQGTATGAFIGSITGRTIGSTLSVFPNDDRVQLDGTALEVGPDGDTASAGLFSVTIRETRVGAPNSPRDTSFTITVTATDTTAPSITSSNTASVLENAQLSKALTANEAVTWTIVGGADSARFEISTSPFAALRWLGNGVKDYEAPDDAGSDNSYIVVVRATDGSGNFTNQTITVTVTDVDEVAPTITSTNTASVAESATLAKSLTANETVTWSIVGGTDAARFEVSGSTLRWLGNGVKDYEAPDDSDANNTYVVQVRATDLAGNSTNQTITVTVTDVSETGSTIDFDFTAPSYDYNGTSYGSLAALLASGNAAFSRAAAGFDIGDADGDLFAYSSGAIKINDRGMLIEPAFTNLALWTNTNDNAGIGKTNVTVTATTVTAPDGSATADTMQETVANGQHRFRPGFATYNAGEKIIASAYLKADTVTRVQMAIGETGFTDGLPAFVNFSLTSTGSVLFTSASNVDSSGIVALKNGWYFCYILAENDITASNTVIALSFINSDTAGFLPTYTGSTSNRFHVWGMQAGVAVYPRSSVISAGTPVAQPQDTFSITLPATMDVTVTYEGGGTYTDTGVSGTWSVNTANSHGRYITDINATGGAVSPTGLPRLAILTDISYAADPDDFQSICMTLLLANNFDIRILGASQSSHGDITAPVLQRLLDAYEMDYPTLVAADNKYPSPATLRARVYQGPLVPNGAPGYTGTQSALSQAILDEAALASPTDPLWVCGYGAATELAEALAHTPSIKANIRLHSIAWGTGSNRDLDPDAADYVLTGQQVGGAHAGLFSVVAQTTFRGTFCGSAGQNVPIPRASFVTPYATGRGGLGQMLDFYSLDLFGIKAGDWSSTTYHLGRAGQSPEDPTKPSWGGYYSPHSTIPNRWVDVPSGQTLGSYPGANTVYVQRSNFLGALQAVLATLPTSGFKPLYARHPYIFGSGVLNTRAWYVVPLEGELVPGTSWVFQWYRAGVAISGATNQWYDFTSLDVASSVTCRGTPSNAAGAGAPMETIPLSGQASFLTATTTATAALTTSSPNTQRSGYYDAFFRMLNAIPNMLTELDVIHLAGADIQSWEVNLKSPGTYNLSKIGSGTGTYTADRGWAGDGVDDQYDTNYNPSLGGSRKFLQNDGHFGVGFGSDAQNSNPAAGWYDGSDGVSIAPRSTSNKALTRASQAAQDTSTYDVTDSRGLFVVNRRGASNYIAYKDQMKLSQPSISSTGLNNATFRLGGATASIFTTYQFDACFIGGGLDDDQRLVIAKAYRGWKVAIGAIAALPV